MTASLVENALDVLEEVGVAALAAVMPAHWLVLPNGTISRLHLDPLHVEHLPAVLVLQPQAPGGLDPRLNSAGWSGPVVLRCLSADKARAQSGRTAAHGALLSIASPTGYSLWFRYTSPVVGGWDEDKIYTAASQYEAVIRRVAT